MRFASLLAVAAAMSISLPARTVQAQNPSEKIAEVGVGGNVLEPLSFEVPAHLDFGYVVRGLDKTVSYSDAGPTGVSSAGQFVLAGHQSAYVQYSWDVLPDRIVKGAGGEGRELPLDLYFCFVGENDAAICSAQEAGEAARTGAGIETAQLSEDGAHYVFVRGTVHASGANSAVETGQYLTTITLRAIYTGL